MIFEVVLVMHAVLDIVGYPAINNEVGPAFSQLKLSMDTSA
jgi:hypothetical protein